MSNRFELNPYEVNVLIDFFMYYLKPEMRGKLMQEFPEIYNKVVGATIVKSKNISEEVKESNSEKLPIGQGPQYLNNELS